jgi:hypothetical protein
MNVCMYVRVGEGVRVAFYRRMAVGRLLGFRNMLLLNLLHSIHTRSAGNFDTKCPLRF